MQKFNCHLQKSKKALFSQLFKITALKTGEEPQRTENPSFYQQERLSQQLENRQRSVINHFIQLQTCIHSHPSIFQQTLHAGLADYRIWKRIGPLARSSSPGGQNPVNTSWPRKPGSKKMNVPQRSYPLWRTKKHGKEATSIFVKSGKTEQLMAQLWHSELAGPIKPKPFQTSYHATQGKPQLFFLTQCHCLKSPVHGPSPSLSGVHQ